MAAIIEFKHVDKYYGKLHALKDINLKAKWFQLLVHQALVRVL